MAQSIDRRQQYRDEVARSRVVAHRLRVAAAVTVAVSAVIGGYAVWSLVAGSEDPAVAVELLLAVGLAGVVSGIAFFATSWGVALSASRLEVQVDPLDD